MMIPVGRLGIFARIILILVLSPINLSARSNSIVDEIGERESQLPKLERIQTLEPPGAKPVVDSVLCWAFRQRNGDTKTRWPADVDSIETVLSELDPTHTSRIARLFSEEFFWWIRLRRRIDFVSVLLASHETSHAVNNLLRFCGDGRYTFFYNGVVYKTPFRMGESPSVYSVLGRRLNELSSQITQLRWTAYMKNSVNFGGNDFFTLLDELVAYTAAARLEVNLVYRNKRQELAPTGIDSFDGNFVGMLDMFVLMKFYLEELRINFSQDYQEILKDKSTVCLLMKLRTDSAEIVGDLMAFEREIPVPKIRPKDSSLFDRAGFPNGVPRNQPYFPGIDHDPRMSGNCI